MKNALIAGIVFAAVVVALLLWKHEGDTRRDGRIEELTHQVSRDSTTVDSLTRESRKAESQTTAALNAFAKRDTVWRRHSDTVTATVDRIVHDTATVDSVKILALAALVEETRHKADSTIRAAEVAAEIVRTDLLLSFAKERAAWTAERKSRAAEISLLKRQSRHWGLCAMPVGYGATRLPDHTVKAGFQAGGGVCYRY